MTDSTISSKEKIRHEEDDYSLLNDVPRRQNKPTLEEAEKEFIGKEIELPFDVGERIKKMHVLSENFKLLTNHFIKQGVNNGKTK